jgi:tRNA threonylcarbamoyladenosine biosynthesis protein TsaB
MLILAIDTSTRTGSAAILRDSEVLAEVSGYEETPYSARIFRDIALLQDKANCRMDQIDVFAVAAGPGSFTGLRVGLTAVKAWAEVYRKPIAAVSGLEAIATASLANGNSCNPVTRYIAPFLDARRGQLFGAIYLRTSVDSADLTLSSDESILSLDEFLELVSGKSPELVQLVSLTP